MSLPDLTQIPWWYYIIAAAFSVYYGWRGGRANYLMTMGQKKENNNLSPLKNFSEKQVLRIYVLHDFLSHFICGLSGFLALYILNQCHHIKTTAESIFVAFLSLYSIVGITDLLPQLLPQGKFPGK